jgi:hypothetical protein
MARSNGVSTKQSILESSPPIESDEIEVIDKAEVIDETGIALRESESIQNIQIGNTQDIDECLNVLKALLSTVEKLQKVRLEVGDVKPFLIRMLDGEVLSGEELEQLKTGVNGLTRLVRAYTDHQIALTKAQPARALLDTVLQSTSTRSQQS